MATPLAHTLTGLTLINLWKSAVKLSPAESLLLQGLMLLAALAPDLDFLPGLLVGEPNRFHQTYSHSLGLALLTALALGGITKWRIPRLPFLRTGLYFFLLYGSHLALDYFTEDYRPPCGTPLFWPFSNDPYTASLPVFLPVKRNLRLPGFWSHTALVLFVEASLLLPLWIASRMRRRDRGKEQLNLDSSREYP